VSDLAHNRDKCRGVVSMVMNHRILELEELLD